MNALGAILLRTTIECFHLPGGHEQESHAGDATTEVPAKKFVATHPYLYHITTRKHFNGIRKDGLRGSKTGYHGAGISLATNPEATQVYGSLDDDDAVLFRVATAEAVKRFGFGPKQLEFDPDNDEVTIPGSQRVIPPQALEWKTKSSGWRKFNRPGM